MDQTSMTLGWLIGRQLAGQRKPIDGKILDMIQMTFAVVDATEAKIFFNADFGNYHLMEESEYSSQWHSFDVLSAILNNDHLIILTDTEDTTV